MKKKTLDRSCGGPFRSHLVSAVHFLPGWLPDFVISSLNLLRSVALPRAAGDPPGVLGF